MTQPPACHLRWQVLGERSAEQTLRHKQNAQGQDRVRQQGEAHSALLLAGRRPSQLSHRIGLKAQVGPLCSSGGVHLPRCWVLDFGSAEPGREPSGKATTVDCYC